MIKFDYICKFCKKPGHIECEDVELLPGKSMFDVSKYIPFICCERCYGYERRRRDLNYAILRFAAKLITARTIFGDQESPDLQTLELKIRDRLIKLTKIFGQVVSGYHKTLFSWEPAMIDDMMNNPHSADKILRFYIRSLHPKNYENPATIPAHV